MTAEGLGDYRLVAQELLDALPDCTAVMDSAGTIVAVNRAWRMFAEDNGGVPAATGVGVNYLDVCERAAAHGCVDAAGVAKALRVVLAGETIEATFDYPCPSPAVGRWFALRASRIDGEQVAVLVSHVNITRQRAAEADLQRRASQDALTGLANRLLFTARLTTALRMRPGRAPRADVAILYIDLDGFKPVNDTFGHAAGDEVLQTVAARLREVLRPQDLPARLGGDEFAVLAPRVTAHGLAALVERIGAALAVPHTVHGSQVHVGASIGAVLAEPGDDAATALSRADEAMYTVKRGRAA